MRIVFLAIALFVSQSFGAVAQQAVRADAPSASRATSRLELPPTGLENSAVPQAPLPPAAPRKKPAPPPAPLQQETSH